MASISLKPMSGKFNFKNSCSNPYLEIISSSKKCFTKVSKSTDKFPFWNEKFYFPESTEDVIVKCWDYKDFSKVPLGVGTLKLQCSSLSTSKLIWIEMMQEETQNNIGEIFFEVQLLKSSPPPIFHKNSKSLKEIFQDYSKPKAKRIVEFRHKRTGIVSIDYSQRQDNSNFLKLKSMFSQI